MQREATKKQEKRKQKRAEDVAATAPRAVVLPVKIKVPSRPVAPTEPARAAERVGRRPSMRLNMKHLNAAVAQEKNSQHATGVMQTAEEHSRAHQARLSQARSQAAVRLEQRLQMRASQANNREE